MDFTEISHLFDGKSIGEIQDSAIDRQWVDEKNAFKPVLRRNVTYVVAAVLFNEEGEVLLTQEGFFPHEGHWYLPAGRVDPGETLATAAKREVREETGVEFEPTALLAVESPSGGWLRFTFTGRITGGKLRTLAEKDSETLQGGYWPVDTVIGAARNRGDPTKNFVLRGSDILKLIKYAVEYRKSDVKPHIDMLPCNTAHSSMLLRPLILCSPYSEKSEDADIYVLSTSKENAKSIKLPLLRYDPRLTAGVGACFSFYKEKVKDEHANAQICGLLGIEHNGETPKVTLKRILYTVTGAGDFHDGILLTLLMKVSTSEPSVPDTTGGCEWVKVTHSDVKEKLLKTYHATDACGPVPYLFV